MFEIVEKFVTISGEQPIIGEPVYLIRLSDCNLNCTYCDTKYKSEVNDVYKTHELKDDILRAYEDYPDIKILFTGGEPLYKGRESLITSIANDLDYINFYVETNGSIKISNFESDNIFYVVDWKTPSSSYENSFVLDNLKNMRIKNDCIKFVVDYNDLDWVKEKLDVISKINPFVDVYLSPQWGKIDLKTLAEFIINNKLPVKYSIQLHKIIWGDIRGV